MAGRDDRIRPSRSGEGIDRMRTPKEERETHEALVERNRRR